MYRLYLSNIRDVPIVVLTHKKPKKINYTHLKNITVRGMFFYSLRWYQADTYLLVQEDYTLCMYVDSVCTSQVGM